MVSMSLLMMARLCVDEAEADGALLRAGETETEAAGEHLPVDEAVGSCLRADETEAERALI